jgi:hypothetical protein
MHTWCKEYIEVRENSHESYSEHCQYSDLLLQCHFDFEEDRDGQEKDEEVRSNVKSNGGPGVADRMAGAITEVGPQLGQRDAGGHLANESQDVVYDDHA